MEILYDKVQVDPLVSIGDLSRYYLLLITDIHINCLMTDEGYLAFFCCCCGQIMDLQASAKFKFNKSWFNQKPKLVCPGLYRFEWIFPRTTTVKSNRYVIALKEFLKWSWKESWALCWWGLGAIPSTGDLEISISWFSVLFFWGGGVVCCISKG